MPNYIKIIFTVVFLLALGNLAYLNKRIFLDTKENVQKIVEVVKQEAPGSPQAAIDECDEECQRIIEEKVSEAVSKLPKTETKTIVKEVTLTPSPKPTTTYIPVGAASSTQNTDWKTTESGGVWIDTTEYGSNVTISWEASMKVANASGRVFVRLLDETHGIGVNGGELSYDSDKYTNVISDNLSFWSGRNFYKVQIKSLNGSEAFFDSGRIKIVAQ